MKTYAEPVTEHAVIVSLRLSEADQSGQQRRIAELAASLDSALSAVERGEFGGVDSKAGYCLLYCYGANADQVFAAIEPLLATFGPQPGSWAIKRFGDAIDITAPRERIELGGPAA